MPCQKVPNGICKLLQLESNWISIESILQSDFISTCQNRLDTVPFYFPDSDLHSGVRKPLQPCYKIEFYVLARCSRCFLYSLQVEEVQINSRCQHFLSVHKPPLPPKKQVEHKWKTILNKFRLWLQLWEAIFSCSSRLENICACSLIFKEWN